MCGICGIVMRDPAARVPAALIDHMATTIAHRGPDDSGRWVEGPVGLGHRRLSIVDLATGHQPMGNEDESVQIVFNGEIYNHGELRPGLEARGHRFRTRSDTEAILHQYEEDGPACAARLRGIFAFAIWDGRTRRLVLARDHTGIKPLYYAVTANGSLVFGSEIKAIMASGLVEPEVNREALPEHLATGHVAGARTLLSGVRKLLPGHTLTWQDGRVELARYWSLPGAWPEAGPGPDTLKQAGEEFWRRFVEAVQSQLMSDVPLGAFLSGGLDSSLLVAAMRQLGVADTNTFSVGYAEAGANELPYARIAASAFGTRHHEVILDQARFFALLPDLTWHRDLPLTFSASIPLFAVSQLASGSVKVVLTGEGSDELFAGYGRYPRALLNRRWARRLDAWLPVPSRRLLSSLAHRAGGGWLGSRLRRSALAQSGAVEGWYLEAFADVGEPLRRALLGPAAGGAWEGPLAFLDGATLDSNPLEALLRLDQQTYLEELLMKQDTMSMAASIESRVPFLDHHLVEWAARLAPGLKLRGFTGKAVVRAAAASRLPRELLGGPKRGFLVPLGEWLRAGAGRPLAEQYLTAAGPGGHLDRTAIRVLWKRHLASGGEANAVWRLLSYVLWEGAVLDRFRVIGREGRRIGGAA